MTELQAPVKFDQDKTHGFSMIPGCALRELAKLFHFGSTKYAADNWRLGPGLDFRRCYDAMTRHALDWLEGEQIDPESKCHHLAAVAFYCFIVMFYEKTGTGIDNRWKSDERRKDNRPFTTVPSPPSQMAIGDYQE